MKRPGPSVLPVAVAVLAGATPAYANNPPAPDGMLSLLLLCPLMLLGRRWAGEELTPEGKKHLVLKRCLLGVTFVLTLGGTGMAIIPLLILLCAGIVRGVRIMQRGKGQRRFAIGGALLIFTFLAVANYVVSVNHYPRSAEGPAIQELRSLWAAESTFQAEKTLDANGNGTGEYGTLEQLRKADLLPGQFNARAKQYTFVVVLKGDPLQDEKAFFVYGAPVHYGDGQAASWDFLPGASLIRILNPQQPLARRTFASDESGRIRAKDVGTSRPVTREEVRSWPYL